MVYNRKFGTMVFWLFSGKLSQCPKYIQSKGFINYDFSKIRKFLGDCPVFGKILLLFNEYNIK